MLAIDLCIRMLKVETIFSKFKEALDNFSLIPIYFFKKVEIFIPLEGYTYVMNAC